MKFVETVYADDADMIQCSAKEMTEGRCTINTNALLGIKDKKISSPDNFVQDAFGGATFFIGTVVFVALLVSGLYMVFGGADENMAKKGQKGMKFSIIGLLLVMFSYAIIRTVLHIATK